MAYGRRQLRHYLYPAHTRQFVLCLKYVLFRPLTLSNFLFQRLVDCFKLNGPLGDTTLEFIVQPLDLRFGLLEFGSFHHLPVSISSGDGKLVCAGSRQEFPQPCCPPADRCIGSSSAIGRWNRSLLFHNQKTPSILCALAMRCRRSSETRHILGLRPKLFSQPK